MLEQNVHWRLLKSNLVSGVVIRQHAQGEMHVLNPDWASQFLGHTAKTQCGVLFCSRPDHGDANERVQSLAKAQTPWPPLADSFRQHEPHPVHARISPPGTSLRCSMNHAVRATSRENKIRRRQTFTAPLTVNSPGFCLNLCRDNSVHFASYLSDLVFSRSHRARVELPEALGAGVGDGAGSPGISGDIAEHIAVNMSECIHFREGLVAA